MRISQEKLAVLNDFIDTAEELLRMTMFQHWLSGGDAFDAGQDAQDRRTMIEKMRAAFRSIHVEIESYETYRDWLEKKLTTETRDAAERKG